MYGNSPEQLNSITNDEQKSFVLAVGGDAADGVWERARGRRRGCRSGGSGGELGTAGADALRRFGGRRGDGGVPLIGKIIYEK